MQAHGEHPPNDQWDALKPTIRDLYLTQNWSLKRISEHFIATYNFNATDRQYKTRLLKWHFDIKKIRRPVYEAMNVVMQHHLSTHGLETVFEVPIRDRTVTKSMDAIRKEIRRLTSAPEMSLSDAESLLHAREVRYTTNAASTDLQIASPVPREGRDSTELCGGSDSSDEYMTPPGEEDDGMAEQPYSSNSSPSYLSQQQHGIAFSDSRRQLDNGNLLPAVRRLGLTSPESYVTRPLRDIPSPRPAINEDYPHHVARENNLEDFDMTSAFAQLTIDPACDDHTKQQISSYFGRDYASHISVQIDHQKSVASKWAAPYFLRCFPLSECQENNSMLCKQTALEIFRSLINQHDNKYIFPCLNWMITALGASEDCKQLIDFLTESCAVIDQEKGQFDLHYGTPFHYALAVVTGNATDKARIGANFEQSTRQIELLWGLNSPNALVTLYHWCWHLMEGKEYAKVSKNLNVCLEASERIMGHYDIVTINCLAMVSRAFAEFGDNMQAMTYLADALQRMRRPPRPFMEYRFKLLARLAALQMVTGHHDVAEQTLREVVEGRVDYTGLNDGHTWSAIQDLCKYMTDQGRAEESQRVWDEMVLRHERVFHTPWYLERGYDLPWQARNQSPRRREMRGSP